MIEFSVAYRIEEVDEVTEKVIVYAVMPEFSDMSIDDITEKDKLIFGSAGLKSHSYLIAKGTNIDNSWVLHKLTLSPNENESEFVKAVETAENTMEAPYEIGDFDQVADQEFAYEDFDEKISCDEWGDPHA